ncbi:hypothetical protein [Propioniciclava coleopterorum]|uniref:hypothetical protein n=1 Tax=Propioniciclava coleopterorum TaxID=2714937 RepID=UPI00198139B8|nr:hypothetical protein [Propioniciclava coleopterorum]
MSNPPRVVLHTGTPQAPGAELGPVIALAPDAVVTTARSLPLPLVVIAVPDALTQPDAGHALPDGRRAFAVTAVHLPEPGIEGEPAAGVRAGQGADDAFVTLALELDAAALDPRDPDMRMPARSFWCLLFPRLQVCR